MNFQMKVLDERVRLKQATPMSAGYDLYACITEPIILHKSDKATLIPTGFALFMNTGNVAGILLPRSGLGHKQGLVLGNTLGLIDGDYQNQWFVSAWNRGQQEEIVINPMDRIAQCIFVPVLHPTFDLVSDFSTETERGLGGFGSTPA